MAANLYPPDLLVHQIPDGERIVGFRAVHVPSRSDPALEESFRSHYEMRLTPQPAEDQHAAIFMAVSLWRRGEIVVRLSRKYSKFGSYVARVELGHGSGFDYLDPELELNPQHLTIWGTKAQLAHAVVDILPI